MTATDALLILGLIVIMAYAVYAAADDVAHESRRRRDLRRARQLERARERMADEHDGEAYQARISEAADVIERSGYRWPDVEKLP